MSHIHTQATDFESLLDVLALEQIGEDAFVGVHPHRTWQRTFGGQLLAQAVIAAGQTVERYSRRPLHSLQAHFVRAGDIGAPITYRVERMREERTLADRMVTASQGERVLARMFLGFQAARTGLEHATPMPPAPAPESLDRITDSFVGREDGLQMFVNQLFPLDIRYADEPPWELQRQGRRTDTCRAWMRADGELPDDPLLNVAVLAWASDMTPLDPIITRHGLAWGVDRVIPATLNHSVWFHRPPRMHEWILYTTTSPVAANSRALVTGQFHTRGGDQIATVCQEDVILAYRRGGAQ